MRTRQRVLSYVLLSSGLLFVVSPFLWTLLSSFKVETEIRRDPPTFLPEQWTIANYSGLLDRMNVGQAALNSLIVALMISAGALLFCSMAGYALAKVPFRGRNVAFAMVMVHLMIPGIVVMIPQFVLVARIGLVDTLAGVVLPYLIPPVGVFLMRQFISDLPDELIQAARIDGAGELRIYLRIILPLCRPALATLGLITFLTSWNNFLWPAVIAQSESTYTLPVALAIFNSREATQYGLLLAGSVVIVTPILILFLFLQRYFVRGIAVSGLK